MTATQTLLLIAAIGLGCAGVASLFAPLVFKFADRFRERIQPTLIHHFGPRSAQVPGAALAGGAQEHHYVHHGVDEDDKD